MFDGFEEAGLKPPDFMPVAERDAVPAQPVIDANELLWAARVLASLAACIATSSQRVRENVKLTKAILESYAHLPVIDPREQRWTVTKR